MCVELWLQWRGDGGEGERRKRLMAAANKNDESHHQSLSRRSQSLRRVKLPTAGKMARARAQHAYSDGMKQINDTGGRGVSILLMREVSPPLGGRLSEKRWTPVGADGADGVGRETCNGRQMPVRFSQSGRGWRHFITVTPRPGRGAPPSG